MADTWPSVQIATLAVSALTPLTVAGLGLLIARASRRLEQVQWANQTVVTRRLDIFAELAPRPEPAAVLRHLRRRLEGHRTR